MSINSEPGLSDSENLKISQEELERRVSGMNITDLANRLKRAQNAHNFAVSNGQDKDGTNMLQIIKIIKAELERRTNPK